MIILEVRPLVYSLEMLVERVRDAVSSTEQLTNTAQLNSTPRRLSGCLDPVLCPRVHSSPQPDADVLLLDRLHNGRGRGDEAKQESNFPLQLNQRQVSVSNLKSNKIQIKYEFQYVQNERFSELSLQVRGEKKCDTPAK